MYNPFSVNNSVTSVERLNDGSFFYNLFEKGSTSGYKSERHKLNTVLCNPAFLTIVKLQCDMFSLGRVKAVLNKRDKDNDPLIKILKQPNPFQTNRQFMWDFMFWNMLGTSYLYSSSKVASDKTNLYWLNPACFVWDEKLINKLDKIALSSSLVKEINKLTIQYNNLDGTQTTYNLGDIKPFFDLSNGLGNWYKGSSTVDALYKVIGNSDAALDSKRANLDFAGKFMVYGVNAMDNINETPMGETEKNSAKASLKSSENVHVLKTPIDVKRFVDNINKLELDKSYFASVYKIGKIYNIPKDVIEAYLENGSTFENQKESKAGWIEQSIMPKAEDLMNGLESVFGYDDRNINLVMSYDHLSFMQVFEKQKQEAIQRELTNLNTAKEMGAIDEIELAKRVKILIGDE